MLLFELIEYLQKIEQVHGGLIPVNLRSSDGEQIALFGIEVEQSEEEEFIVVLE